MKHTKGPWKVSRTSDFNGADYLEVSALNGERIIYEGYNRKRDAEYIPQAEADAHLIAAAPDLYESLKIVQAISKSIDTKEPSTIGALARIEEQLKFALAKAEGREE